MHHPTKSTPSVTILLMILFFNSLLTAQPWKDHGPIQVCDKNPHYLAHQDGTPFFWLADTGWEMLHRLNRHETDLYFENRKAKGFNVIQTVLISEFIRMDKPGNYYNDPVFMDDDPHKPAITKGNNPNSEDEYDYWDHVDYAVQMAQSKGLYLALVATWGEWVTPRTQKPLFDTPEQTYQYGWFIGNRYAGHPNIIWILGGDRHPDERPNGIELWRAMAEGIADGTNNIHKPDGVADYSTTLMTHHAFNSSSTWFHSDSWIDFHTWGSYHAEYNNSKSYEATASDWNLANPKPTFNSEPCYEGHGLNYAIEDNGVFTSVDLRMAAYWSVFTGAAGFTYGAQPIWQFTDSLRPKFSAMTFTSWQKGMDYPGAFQMIHLKNLMLSKNMLQMTPDQSVLLSGEGKCDQHTCAIRNHSTILVYTPVGNPIRLNTSILSGKTVQASWFDPRTGNTIPIGTFENSGELTFQVPGMSKELGWLKSGRGCDWVLVVEETSGN